MKRLAYILCLVELALLLLVPLSAWLASVLGYNVLNLVSGEGLRWLFNHGSKALVSLQLAYLILLLSAIGAVQETGVLRDFCGHRLHRKALLASSVFFTLFTLVLLLPAILPSNALLSVTGSLVPSPWLTGYPMAQCIIVIIASLIYSAVSGTLGGFMGIPRILSVGISRHAIWVVVAIMGTMIVRIIKYINI